MMLRPFDGKLITLITLPYTLTFTACCDAIKKKKKELQGNNFKKGFYLAIKTLLLSYKKCIKVCFYHKACYYVATQNSQL